MFSGIVEKIGKVEKISNIGSNKQFVVSSPFSFETYIDQSIAHDGVCLTVVSSDQSTHTVTAIHETLGKTNLDHWKVGDMVNLERSLLANSRVDGHFVQGHVDTVASCQNIEDRNGSWIFTFMIPEGFNNLIVIKGSICINGVSLTVAAIDEDKFSVAIIPYTYEHTNFNKIQIGTLVNLEFDILGKYIVSYLERFHK